MGNADLSYRTCAGSQIKFNYRYAPAFESAREIESVPIAMAHSTKWLTLKHRADKQRMSQKPTLSRRCSRIPSRLQSHLAAWRFLFLGRSKTNVIWRTLACFYPLIFFLHPGFQAFHGHRLGNTWLCNKFKVVQLLNFCSQLELLSGE